MVVLYSIVSKEKRREEKRKEEAIREDKRKVREDKGTTGERRGEDKRGQFDAIVENML